MSDVSGEAAAVQQLGCERVLARWGMMTLLHELMVMDEWHNGTGPQDLVTLSVHSAPSIKRTCVRCQTPARTITPPPRHP